MKSRKDCDREYYQKYPWRKHYKYIMIRCVYNKNDAYYKKGIKNFLTCDDVKYLWKRDNAEKLDRPSIDRIDNSKDYTLDNCRFIEFLENIRNRRFGGPRITKRKDIMQYSRDGKFIKQWKGIAITAKELNISLSSMKLCLRGKFKHSGGYVWKYCNP